ncbi:MAG: hypothetical protein AAFP84_04755, partial [Actinomycetota bacterium]
GRFERSAIFGSGPNEVVLTSAGFDDSFVAKVDVDGALEWVRRFGGRRNVDAVDVAVDPSGDVVVAGVFENTASFGDDAQPGGRMTSAGSTDVFVARLTAAGDLDWVRRIGGPPAETLTDMAISSSGDIVLTGEFFQSLELSPTADIPPLTSAGRADQYIVQLDSAGDVVGGRGLGGPNPDFASPLTFDAAGRIVVAGSFRGAVDFASDLEPATLIAVDEADAYVATLGPGLDLVSR